MNHSHNCEVESSHQLPRSASNMHYSHGESTRVSSGKRVAILVDAGFYLRRAHFLFGEKSPQDRANELVTYAHRHLKGKNNICHDLHRIYVYNCRPSNDVIFHPFTRKNIHLDKTDTYRWHNEFHKLLNRKSKLSLHLGEPLKSGKAYNLKIGALKKLCNGTMSIEDLTESDFKLDIQQKGIDVRIGIDMVHLATKRLVDKIVLISGDSDFVPAAKYARYEGIEIILDPMRSQISDELHRHIDNLISKVKAPPRNLKDTLCNLPEDTYEK